MDDAAPADVTGFGVGGLFVVVEIEFGFGAFEEVFAAFLGRRRLLAL